MHTGSAKDKMINALTLACEFQQGFPAEETPEQTEGKQGFYHLSHFTGHVEKVELQYLIRDFDRGGFEQRKIFIQQLVDRFNQQKRLKSQSHLKLKTVIRT